MNIEHAIRDASEPKTITEALESAIVHGEPRELVIRDAHELDMAIANASMDGQEYLIVGDELMTRKCKNPKTPSITVGSPGVRLYREGHKIACDRIDDMNSEAFYTHDIATRPAPLKKPGRR